jgi:hypothetical protein
MKCCICGAVKNCANHIDKIFDNMEKIGSLFEDYVIIMYYDESHDGTLEKLKSYQSKNNKLQFYVNKKPLSPHRTHNIANARNGCIQMIRQKYSDYSFFIMMDCDDVCCQDVKLNVLNKYLYRTDWDALSFNKQPYYDIWALSIRPFIFSHRHFHDVLKVQNKMTHYITTLISKVSENGLLKCCSAFNGFSIYRTEKFLNCKYDGKVRLDLIPRHYLTNNMKYAGSKIVFKNEVERRMIEDCEHRSFHFSAINKNGARIRISPEILF